jgi:hypothetical protein
MRKLMREHPSVEKNLMRYRNQRLQDMEKRLAEARQGIPAEPEG